MTRATDRADQDLIRGADKETLRESPVEGDHVTTHADLKVNRAPGAAGAKGRFDAAHKRHSTYSDKAREGDTPTGNPRLALKPKE